MKQEQIEALRALKREGCDCGPDLLCLVHRTRFHETWDCRYAEDLVWSSIPQLLAEREALLGALKEAVRWLDAESGDKGPLRRDVFYAALALAES